MASLSYLCSSVLLMFLGGLYVNCIGASVTIFVLFRFVPSSSSFHFPLLCNCFWHFGTWLYCRRLRKLDSLDFSLYNHWTGLFLCHCCRLPAQFVLLSLPTSWLWCEHNRGTLAVDGSTIRWSFRNARLKLAAVFCLWGILYHWQCKSIQPGVLTLLWI